MSPLSLVFLLYTLVLVGVSLAILYPVYCYSHRVMHPSAIRVISLSVLLLTVGEVANRFHSAILSDVLHTGATMLLAYAAWKFAREFVSTARTEPELVAAELFDESTTDGGFEDDT